MANERLTEAKVNPFYLHPKWKQELLIGNIWRVLYKVCHIQQIYKSFIALSLDMSLEFIAISTLHS